MASNKPPPPPPPPPPAQTPPPANQIPRPPRMAFKTWLLTGAFAAVAVVGAIYGAGLKTQQEYKKEKQKIVEASAEDRIRDLEGRRATLVAYRRPIERKLDDLRARMRDQDLKDAAAATTAAAADKDNKVK
ncbi:uncharacterized protein GGS22DRAFT_187286 [Annulohypoxylon maeteangense]|uniref:uncharacterized protein n=1 Tax=Annulohypoxylon maeteangense TaxID=1927788 RepID=UPI00200888B0|nr:uncharacterized protein GGS22DRAFT_187286 [Annulohypoxylon maeteangense]KAI0886055.1 hypothetical protein GGS22DRAFT_187286 [Annulohypoxylon maeteangense]